MSGSLAVLSTPFYRCCLASCRELSITPDEPEIIARSLIA